MRAQRTLFGTTGRSPVRCAHQIGWLHAGQRWLTAPGCGLVLSDNARRRGQRAASGWEALTPAEVKIAALVARGDSTSDIARGMFLSRRTVQTYISRILAKLGAKGRVEIVREALRRGVSP